MSGTSINGRLVRNGEPGYFYTLTGLVDNAHANGKVIQTVSVVEKPHPNLVGPTIRYFNEETNRYDAAAASG